MKQIYVQAQADHIESLFKGSPLAAIEELIPKSSVWKKSQIDFTVCINIDLLKIDTLQFVDILVFV